MLSGLDKKKKVQFQAYIAGTLFEFNLGLWFSVDMIVLVSGSILY